MAKIKIDNQCYEVEDGQNLLSACLSLKKNLPYFCWHPAMGSVGACRQCAVMEYRDAADKQGRLVMSCMTVVKDNGIYSISADEACQFRGSVIENLMTNHPHDCPVCEEGGECHLQDMTEMSGHNSRRYKGMKRTFKNQYLGPFINHEMNRCITCYRCIRFYNDYAGGKDLQALGRNNKVYFGRSIEGRLENGFSGNLVEVCPTGVFTDKTFSEHFVRKWDLQTAPSVCEHCGVGCNTAPGARQGGKDNKTILRRITNLFHKDINGHFLCDRGRFGYDYVNSKSRILYTHAVISKNIIKSTNPVSNKVHQDVHPRKALEILSKNIQQSLVGKRKLIGIGSSRSSLENNFSLLNLVSDDNFYAGVNAEDINLIKLIDNIQHDPLIHSPTIPEIENSDCILILGEDISNTAPRIALAVRQAARNLQKLKAKELNIPLWQDDSVRQLKVGYSPVFIFSVEQTNLEDIAKDIFYSSEISIVQFSLYLISKFNGLNDESNTIPNDQLRKINYVFKSLKEAKNPLVISGCGLQSEAIVKCTANLAKIINKNLISQKKENKSSMCSIYLACEEVNSLGLVQVANSNKNLSSLSKEINNNSKKLPVTLIILETDLYRKLLKSVADYILDASDQVIHIDSLHNTTSASSDLLLPAAATAESEGTLVNNNGLAQRHYAVYEGAGYIQESWRWLSNAAMDCIAKIKPEEASKALLEQANWQHVSEIWPRLTQKFPKLQVIEELGPDHEYRINGLKVARQSHRNSGRTAVNARQKVAEQLPIQDPDAPMSFTMEGIQSTEDTSLQANIWSPGWNSNQAIHKFQNSINASRNEISTGKFLQRSVSNLSDWSFDKDNNINLEHEREDKLNEPVKKFYLHPLYRMFGSGELSAKASAIESIITMSFIQMNPYDAQTLGLNADDELEISINKSAYRVRLTVSPFMPKGNVGFSKGFTNNLLFENKIVWLSDIKKVPLEKLQIEVG